MITISRLVDSSYLVEEFSTGLVRCADRLPKKTFYSYFKICDGAGNSPFLTSEDIIDDDFAKLILLTCRCRTVDKLTKESLKSNRFGFTHILYVPHQYHFELQGRLDAERLNTTLCVPIFNSEFSGSEQREEFIELRRYLFRHGGGIEK